MPTPDGYLTTTEFARQAGISPSTVSKWLRNGKIIGRKSGGKWLIDSNQLPAEPAEQPDQNPAKVEAESNEDRSYTIEEFSSMTYLTPFGVEKWLKEGRLTGSKDKQGRWHVDSSNLDRPDVKRLVRK